MLGAGEEVPCCCSGAGCTADRQPRGSASIPTEKRHAQSDSARSGNIHYLFRLRICGYMQTLPAHVGHMILGLGEEGHT